MTTLRTLILMLMVAGQGAAAEFDRPEAVVDTIRAQVARCHVETANERYEVVVLPSLGQLTWDETDSLLELTPPSHPCGVGRLTWFVRMQRDGRTVVKPVGIEVRKHVQALALLRNLARSELLQDGDVVTAWFDVTHVTAVPLRTLEGLGSVSLTRRGWAGSMVTEAMIKATPVVKMGDRVTVLYVRAGFQIRLDGVAREDGAVGDEIRVKNLSSGQIITGIVAGPSMVKM